MSTKNLNTYIENLGCFPHQAEFAAKFLTPDSKRKHLLTSSPGLGKGFVGSAIVGYSATHGQDRQILVLAPTALAHQWVEEIRRVNPSVPCEFVDRRRLRELESQQSSADSVWGQIGVVVMSIDFAKRPDMTGVIAERSWDFLVVDEAHQLAPQTQRQKLVTALVEHNPEMRVLYLHPLLQISTGEEKNNPLLKDIETTVWSRETVRDKDGKPLLPEVQIEWISHARQPEEAALLTQLQETLNVIAGHGRQGQLIATHLMKAASSSQFALEQQLNRMQHLRNQITHGLEEFLNDSDRDTNLWSDDIESNPTPNLYQQTLLKFSDRIAALIETLEAVRTDSKLDSLISLLNRLGLFSSSDRRVCIFTSYIATATFLESTLSEHHSHVASVTGSLSYTEREQAVSDFGQNGGILIATPAMSMWIPEVAAVIFYDLPMNPATLDAGIGEYIRIGRSGPAHICAFTDESEMLLIEQLQKTIEIEKALGSDEALKRPFPDDHTKMNGSQECSE